MGGFININDMYKMTVGKGDGYRQLFCTYLYYVDRTQIIPQ
jgi:hypothetical protein